MQAKYMMLYLASKNADAKSCLMSSDLLGTNVISQVENFPVKVNIAEKSTNKKNGVSKSLIYCALYNMTNI